MRYKNYGDSLDRYRQLNTLDLAEVEQEIDLMISISDNPSMKTIEEITKLIKLAKALGSRREW